MKFSLCLIVLGLIATVHTESEVVAEQGEFSDSKYFTNVLDNIQGALIDTVMGGEDLKVMISKLEALVDESSSFFLAESVAEYAVNKDAYSNSWTHDNIED